MESKDTKDAVEVNYQALVIGEPHEEHLYINIPAIGITINRLDKNADHRGELEMIEMIVVRKAQKGVLPPSDVDILPRCINCKIEGGKANCTLIKCPRRIDPQED